MKTRLVGFVLIAMMGTGMFWCGTSPLATAVETAPRGSETEVVEGDMHEFMEYLFQPTYKRLQASMAEAPTNNAGWKSIKSDALILAEGGNLLVLRPAEDDASDWKTYSREVRELGGKLYQAAKAKDFPKARGHYEAMLQRCNACHDQFAGGEHQLKP